MTDPNDFNARVIDEFRANRGRLGGPFEGGTVLLLHTTGARSGQPRVNPVMYRQEGDRYFVFGSKGGSDDNPAWYHNLKAHPDTEIEVGDRTIPVHAEQLEGDERDGVYARHAQRYPMFADYERKTSRRIPVMALTPVAVADRAQT
jgi:deazaflavin-dependent oxidoreductase (nitroreductase family)